LIFASLAMLIILFSMFRIVREYERLVVFRLGRAIGAKGPGLVLLLPFVDKAVGVFSSSNGWRDDLSTL